MTKNNANDWAFPLAVTAGTTDYPGMTKRELIAMHCLQGILAAGGLESMATGIAASEAVHQADDLLAELAK